MKKILLYALPLSILAIACAAIGRLGGGLAFDSRAVETNRRAKILRIRSERAAALAKRLEKNPKIAVGDLVLVLSEEAVDKLTAPYVGGSFVVEPGVKIQILSVKTELLNGAAIATLRARASDLYGGVSLRVEFDCLLSLKKSGEYFELRFYPFNVVPKARDNLFKGAAANLIENVVKIELSKLEKKLPPVKIPVKASDYITIPEKKSELGGKFKLGVLFEKKTLKYSFRISEIIFLAGKIVVNAELTEAKAV